MKVSLIAWSKDCERIIAVASKQSLSGKPFEVSWEKMDEEEIKTWIKETLKRGHLSPWEHCSYTFVVEGVSRVLTHQLVRHRLASYTQLSQRYKRVSGEYLDPVVPPRIVGKGKEAIEKYYSAIRFTAKVYQELIKMGVHQEDARYVLPQGVKTKIVVTMNARELLHFFGLRLCTRAQWEIRALAWMMLKSVYEKHPILWQWAGPRCLLAENSVRREPLTLQEILGIDPFNNKIEPGRLRHRADEIGLIQERCPEMVPRDAIPTCIAGGLKEALEYISRLAASHQDE